jgi:hypothetical protein
VEGESLPQYIARTGKLPAMQALALVGQLLAALDEVHRRGLACPGLACDDLLVLPCGRLAMTAWAVAQRDQLVLASRVEDDLLAAARMAYALVTRGTLADTDVEREAAWVPPSHAGLPVGLDGVFERAMSRDAQERYPTADALWQAIWDAMGPPIWDRPLKPVTRAIAPRKAPAVQPAALPVAARTAVQAAPRRSNRAVLAGAAVAMLLAFAIGAIGWQLFAGADAQRVQPAPLAQEVQSLQQPSPPPAAPERVEVAATTEPEAPQALPAPAPAATAQGPVAAARVPTPVKRIAPPAAVEPSRARREQREQREQRALRPAREPQRTAVAAGSASRLQQVGYQADPTLGCGQGNLFTRELCKLSKCDTAAFSRHPTCRALRDEQRRRDWEADQALRTR